MKTREQQIDFIRLNGVRIAACAWNGFQEKGRGMIFVPSDLENYDPNIEVVICFVRKAEEDRTDIDSYRFKTRPAPPDAAEQE